MFGAKYSRMKFWLLNLPVFLFGSLVLATARIVSEGFHSVAALVLLVILAHILANRIRGFGSNPWLALWAIIPFVGIFQAFYYGCKESGR